MSAMTGEESAVRTVEEGIQRIVLDFTQLEKVFARPRTPVDLEVDHNVAERRLEEDGHGE